MAGYDPKNPKECESDLVTADPGSLAFDICERITGVPEYRITIAYDPAKKKINVTKDEDRDGDGIPTTLVEDVDAFGFRYLNNDETPATDPNKNTKVVEISMLVRSTYPDRKHTDTANYIPPSTNPSDWIFAAGVSNPPNDNYHRRLLTTSIALRNM